MCQGQPTGSLTRWADRTAVDEVSSAGCCLSARFQVNSDWNSQENPTRIPVGNANLGPTYIDAFLSKGFIQIRSRLRCTLIWSKEFTEICSFWINHPWYVRKCKSTTGMLGMVPTWTAGGSVLRLGVTWCGPLLRVIRQHHPGQGATGGCGWWELVKMIFLVCIDWEKWWVKFSWAYWGGKMTLGFIASVISQLTRSFCETELRVEDSCVLSAFNSFISNFSTQDLSLSAWQRTMRFNKLLTKT